VATDIRDDQIQVTAHSEILSKLETAARLYCERMGYDPDLPVPKPHPLGLQVPYTQPNWMDVAMELYDFQVKLVCLKEAAAGKLPMTPKLSS
jgi:hypothetical protein